MLSMLVQCQLNSVGYLKRKKVEGENTRTNVYRREGEKERGSRKGKNGKVENQLK